MNLSSDSSDPRDTELTYLWLKNDVDRRYSLSETAALKTSKVQIKRGLTKPLHRNRKIQRKPRTKAVEVSTKFNNNNIKLIEEEEDEEEIEEEEEEEEPPPPPPPPEPEPKKKKGKGKK